MKTDRYIVLLALVLFALTMQAQRTESVEGYARIEQSDYETPAQARTRVVQQAQFDAINAKFGSNLTQSNVTMMHNENGQAKTSFYMLGESDLRGTWVRDTKEPRVEQQVVDGRIIWEAWVKGEAREMKRAKVNFEWKLLANGTSDRHQVEALKDGDAFYVKFRSPVKGYLLLFMADDAGKVTCALPAGEEEYCKVEANKWHLFYHDEKHPDDHWIATLPEGKPVEYDQFYVVFSPNKIAPPTRDVNVNVNDLQRYYEQGYEVGHIPELTFKDFHKYMGKLQHRDAEVQQEKMQVKISR